MTTKTHCVDCEHSYLNWERHLDSPKHKDKALLNQIRNQVRNLPTITTQYDEKPNPVSHPPKNTPEWREWNLNRMREYARENKEKIREYQRLYRLKHRTKSVVE